MQETTKTNINELVYPIWLKNFGTAFNDLPSNQQETSKVLENIFQAIQRVDLESAFKHDILDAASIKRRLYRIRILNGEKITPNGFDTVKEWEGCVQSSLNMTKRELLRSIDLRKIDKTIFDVIDEIPEFRKIGVDILVALERKYKIAPALYSVEQVRQIGVLRREFDHSVVRVMNEQEFNRWVDSRYMEMHEMFKGYEDSNQHHFNYGRYKLYWMFAKKHPDLIPEQQFKYLSDMDLINICDRAINDIEEGDIRFQFSRSKYFPLSDRKHDTKTLKDSFIDIILRCLIC